MDWSPRVCQQENVAATVGSASTERVALARNLEGRGAGVADDEPQGESGEDASTAPLDTFARRLDYLFRTVHPRGQRPYSYERVAEAVTRDQGIDISGNYIWMLRSGRRDNPTLKHMEGLARFFGVSPAFLSDAEEAERVRGQLNKLRDLADSGVEHVALRGGTIDENTLDVIHSLLDRVRDLTEGLRGDVAARSDEDSTER